MIIEKPVLLNTQHDAHIYIVRVFKGSKFVNAQLKNTELCLYFEAPDSPTGETLFSFRVVSSTSENYNNVDLLDHFRWLLKIVKAPAPWGFEPVKYNIYTNPDYVQELEPNKFHLEKIHKPLFGTPLRRSGGINKSTDDIFLGY